MSARTDILVLGCGAIGSWFVGAWTDPGVVLTLIDREWVAAENAGIATFDATDVGRRKVEALAARRRGHGFSTHALAGDVRDVVSAGLVRAVPVIVIALDNPRAIHDAAAAIWPAATPGTLVLVLTCGNAARPGWMARAFVTPGVCPRCLFGEAERVADRAAAAGARCAVSSAPRASAASAAAAAEAGVAITKAWLAGDRSGAGCRTQADAVPATPWVAQLPRVPSPTCPVVHDPDAQAIDLDGSVTSLTIGTLVDQACRRAGADAVLHLGRRGVVVGGLFCRMCGARWATPPYLLRGAAALRPCRCAAAPEVLVERHTLAVAELGTLDREVSLATWGAVPGDEFVAIGGRGRARLRTVFAWEDVDDAGCA